MGYIKPVPTEYNNIRFDSLLEKNFYIFIQPHVDAVEVHVPIFFLKSSQNYTVDFILTKGDRKYYVDTKAPWTNTKMFRFKKKLLEDTLKIHIDIVYKEQFQQYVKYINEGVSYGFFRWTREQQARLNSDSTVADK
ncbi:MAG: hypothetical protein ACRCY4_09615 [Brevinema sp.]